mmetsp:Transcript_2236/g.4421  ORF Transcript_2236/g.4421 Transcript_2236/m.4421 type:complete len:209 (-) Transcript_2236:468-1094(-)
MSSKGLNQPIQVERGIQMHFLIGTICLENVGQIEDSTTVATIHQGHHVGPMRQRLDQDFVQVIVTNHSGTFLVIHRHEGFVVAIFFFLPIVVPEFGTVSGIMQKDGITGLCLGNDFLVGRQYVFLGGWRVFSVVHEDLNVFFGESVDGHDVFFHVQDIVVTSPQFPGIVTNVIDANHDGPTRPRGGRWDQIKVGIHINRIRGRQLGNL